MRALTQTTVLDRMPDWLTLVSTKQAARLLGIAHCLAVVLIREHGIPRHRDGTRLVLDRDSLVKLERALIAYRSGGPTRRGPAGLRERSRS